MIVGLLQEVTEALEKAEIPYMISGSMAMLNFATSRVTRDVDIVVELKFSDFDKFVQIFEKEFYLHPESIKEAIFDCGMFNVIDHRSCYKVDFVVKKRSEYREIEFSRRIRANVYGFEFWSVAIEDLILSKIIWIQDFESDRQKEDITNLLRYPIIDFNYINHWIQKLNLKIYDLKL